MTTRTETLTRPYPGAPRLEHLPGCPNAGVQPAIPMPDKLETYTVTPSRMNDHDPQGADVTVSRCLQCGAMSYSNGARG